METWLYEEGEDCPRQVYIEKFNALKVKYLVNKIGFPVSSLNCCPIIHNYMHFL